MSRKRSAGVPLKHANRRVPIRDVRPLSPAERSERYRQGLRWVVGQFLLWRSSRYE
jgi:hypothetical protein